MRVLIAGGAAPAPHSGFVAVLAEHCDAVFAADAGGAACLAAGVIPSLVVGDLDSLGVEDQRRLREAGARFVVAAAEKDITDLDLALRQARDAGADEVWTTGVFGGRLDHTLATIGSLSRHADVRPRVLETDLSAWLLSPEGAPHLVLRGKGALVSLFAVRGTAVVTCEGFRYALARETLPPLDSRGLSNVIESDEATVEAFDGSVLVVSLPMNGVGTAWDRDFERIEK